MEKEAQKFVDEFMAGIVAKNAGEPEFHQAVKEVAESLAEYIVMNPVLSKMKVLERIAEPERVIIFRVPWLNDKGEIEINRGYRVQMNSAIGPYKGGIRFHPSVNLSILKFLAFEQTFKNSLTTLPMGGGKGGSDFNPKGKSDNEVMRFCQSFVTELARHIGQDTDVPAGDIGVGGREIGYLYGMYRKLARENTGVLTGKGMTYGGSLIRPEATGYGAVYYLQEVLKHEGDTIEGKRIALSGYGNVGWGIMKKAAELGAKVTYMSGPDGYVHDPDGINTEEKLNFILEMRAKDPMHCKPYADRFGCEFVAGAKHWGAKDVDVNMPSAMQNDVRMDSAEKIAASGVKYYIEVANMPTTNDALNFLRAQKHMIVAPSKAVNAGGVGVSALEMAQNSERLVWTAEEVDAQLHKMMKTIHQVSAEAAEEYGLGYDLVAGANIAGFKKVAEAMMAQGCF